MRNAGEGIRSVVLNGPYPPGVPQWFNLPGYTSDVLTRLSASCAAQPACHAAFPDVEQTFWRTVDDLERNPWTRQVPRADGRVDTITTTAATFTGRLQDTMRTPQGLATVPLLVQAMSARNEAVLNAPALQRSGPPDELQVSWGLYYAVQCFEEAPLNTAELKERLRRSYTSVFRSVLVDGSLFNDPAVCEGMHSFRADDAHVVPVSSPLPTLIVTGEFDPQTHRSNGTIVHLQGGGACSRGADCANAQHYSPASKFGNAGKSGTSGGAGSGSAVAQRFHRRGRRDSTGDCCVQRLARIHP